MIANIDRMEVSPSDVPVLFLSSWKRKRTPYLHGPPGIGKSSILMQLANSMGRAFIDVRLATRTPSQIAGIPFPTEEHGQTSVKFSIPVEFPRDIDVEHIENVDARRRVDFSSLNPIGANKIHYCQNPEIAVTALDPLHEAIVVEETLDRFTIVLRNKDDGEAVRGRVLYTIKGKVKALLCFDELSSANQSVQAVAYSLINDRRMGDYIFPDDVYVAAAGNREEDGGVNYTMVQPLRNRFKHYTLKVSWQEWVAWAKLENLYKTLIAFHEETEGKYLFNFDANSSEMAWPSPRTWHMLSDDEYELDAMGVTDPRLRGISINSTVGTKPLLLYTNYKAKITKNLPSVSDIISGTVTGKHEKRIGVQGQAYLVDACIHPLVNRAKLAQRSCAGHDTKFDSDEWRAYFKAAENVISFWMSNIAPDIIAGAIRSMSVTHRLPLHPKYIPSFSTYLANNKDHIV